MSEEKKFAKQDYEEDIDALTLFEEMLNLGSHTSKISEFHGKHEEKHEEKHDIDSMAFTNIFDYQNVKPYEEDDFNIDNLVSLFNNNTSIHTTHPDEDVDVDFLDRGNAEVQFEKLVGNALAKALANRNPEDVASVFSTLGHVSQKVEQGIIGFAPTAFIEEIVNEQFPIDKLHKLKGRMSQPVDIGNLIENLFHTELDDLSKRNLSQEEIHQIRIDFKSDLDDLEYTSNFDYHIDLEQNFLYNQNTFRMLQDYINSTVENNQLKQLLLGDIQLQIAKDRDLLGIQLGQAPPQIIPLSATRTKVLREPHTENIGRIFSDELKQIERTQLRIDRSRREPTRLKAIQADKVRDAVTIFNNFAQRNNIRNPRTGLPIIIETEEKKEIEITGKIESGPHISIMPVSTKELIRMLREMTNSLNRGTVSYEYVPTLIRDPATGITRENIIKDIIDMERKMKDGKIRKPKKQLQSSIHKRAKFPNVEVLTAKRRIQKMKDGNISMGAQMREIRIKSDVSLGELAKISNMIAMESGSLEDIHQQPLLDIRKGITTIQEIVNTIMEVQKHSGGNDFSLIFVPALYVGGMHLGGSLDAIIKNRMLISPIRSSKLKAVNEIGTVEDIKFSGQGLANPIYGGTFVRGRQSKLPKKSNFSKGGSRFLGLPRFKNQVLKKNRSLYFKNSVINNIAKQESPTHQSESFISSDPGLHTSRTSMAHSWPFGGRINNTGFIDQSQMNPKFPWLDIPMISLTAFG